LLGEVSSDSVKALLLDTALKLGWVLFYALLNFIPGLHYVRKKRYSLGLALFLTFGVMMAVAIYCSILENSVFVFYQLFFFHVIVMYLGLNDDQKTRFPDKMHVSRFMLWSVAVTIVSLFYIQVQGYTKSAVITYTIQNDEYSPTFERGDLILIHPYQDGDEPIRSRNIVLFSSYVQGARWGGRRRPLIPYRRTYQALERVLAVAGDTVSMSDERIFVNDEQLGSEALPLVEYSPNIIEETLEVPVDSVMVLCSYRQVRDGGEHTISRVIMLTGIEIKGRAVRILGPSARAKKLP
jgi:signal peptidase I